jgi:hypothetical protein
LNGGRKAFAPLTFTFRLKTLSPQVAYRTSMFGPPKVRFDTLPFGVGLTEVTWLLPGVSNGTAGALHGTPFWFT